MTIRTGLRDLRWMVAGTIFLTAVVFLALRSHRVEDAATRSADRARRVELVERMRASLSAASEAANSAVMAITDEESGTFADQARAVSAALSRQRDDMGNLLETGGTRDEKELLSRFSQGLAECDRIDRELLDLAVRNTNLKAYSLDFGPAADSLAEMDGALSRILKKAADSAAPEARRVMLLAAGAQSGALRIQALLPPHIAEESDRRMTEMEARMAHEDQVVRSDLKNLAPLLGSGNPDLETATVAYARFTDLKARILELSRENTNVRSLIISLNQKRKAVQICQDELAALEQAIRGEAATDQVPANPR